MRRSESWIRYGAPAGLFGLLIACAAFAQTSQVTLTVNQDDMGIQGVVRSGMWMPMRVQMQNLGAQPREVIYEWVLKDADGDQVRSSDTVVLTPQSNHARWLYAVPPLNWDGREAWKVRLYDKESGQLLSQIDRVPTVIRPSTEGMIGVTGQGVMNGLSPFSEIWTQHEPIYFQRMLDTTKLPDRWYGLSSMQAIIWTPDGAPPSSSKIREANREALRGWVVRGGHLIVVMQAIGDPWYKSDLADLLPEVEIEDLADVPRPDFLGARLNEPQGYLTIDVHKLTPKPFSGVSVIHQDNINGQDVPLVVSHQVGMGRVTVIGIELSARSFSRAGLPNNKLKNKKDKFWQKIFAWRSPGFTGQEIKNMQDPIVAGQNPTMVAKHLRAKPSIDALISDQIAMTQTAGGALALSILAFGLYFVLACVVGPIVLKTRKLNKHSWLLFAATVLAFTAFTWGGALLIRPQKNRIKHYSVIRMDAASNTYHVHSWLKLLYARHGKVDVTLDTPQKAKGHWKQHTLASAGVRNKEAAAGFIDPQQYQFSSANPTELTVPMRATAKQFELDYLARVGNGTLGDEAELDEKWQMPLVVGKIKVHPNGGLSGKLTHGLPGDLKDVTLIYTQGQDANQWRYFDRSDGLPAIWPANTNLALPKAITDLPPARVQKSFSMRLPTGTNSFGGFLPTKINNTAGYDVSTTPTNKQAPKVASPKAYDHSILLSFFDALPPPEYHKTNFGFQPKHFQRNSGRVMDISKLLPLKRRLILIGYLEDVPLPAPLRVEGGTPASSGFTMVQWVYELPE